MYGAHKERSRAVGVKKPQEAQKAKALWKMKAAKEAGEEYYDPTRKDNILGRNETRLAPWGEHLKDPIIALDKALKCVKIGIRGLGPSALWRERSLMGAVGFLQSLWERRSGRAFGPTWIRWTVCLRTASMEWNVPGKYGPHGELFFFQIQKEPA